MRDPEEDALLAAAVEEARAAVAAGEVVPHAVVREWLKDLAAVRYRPPPLPAPPKPAG
jgi:predicted transcriptional regulator